MRRSHIYRLSPPYYPQDAETPVFPEERWAATDVPARPVLVCDNRTWRPADGPGRVVATSSAACAGGAEG